MPSAKNVKKSVPIDELENLVNELLRSSPKEKLIQELMEKMKIEYTDDPVQRMSVVLQAIEH